MFQFAQRRKLYFLISACVIVPGLIAMLYSTLTYGSPVRLSIDFQGGSLLEIPLIRDVGEQEVRDTLEGLGVDDYIVQRLDPKGISTSGAIASSRYQVVIPSLAGLDRQAAVDSIMAYLGGVETLGAMWTPAEGETGLETTFPEEGGALLELAFVDSVDEGVLREALERYGLVDYSVARTVAPTDAENPPGSAWLVSISDTELVKTFVNVPDQLWSPSSDTDDPRNQDSLVSYVKGGNVTLDVTFAQVVEEVDLAAALDEYGLANVQLESQTTDVEGAGSRWLLRISDADLVDFDALRAFLADPERLGGLYQDAEGIAAFNFVRTGERTIVVDVSFADPTDAQAVEELFASSGLSGIGVSEKTPLPTQAGSRWQIRMKETDRATLDRLLRDLQSPENLGEFWSPESLKADPERNDAFSSSSVSETVGEEVTRAAVVATLAVAVIVLGFIVFAFRKVPHAFRYGACAIIAMFHDILITMGVMSILGILFGWEADALFLTAILTVVGFSVQDSIVVFDRIRENIPKYRGEEYEMVVNRSVLETVHRSLATQLNAIFVMVAILLFGGETIKQFIGILLIGLMSGTYSSIFNAVPLLVAWEKGEIPFVNREAKRAAQEEATA